ncbi:MAG TPA: hypothetical protein VFZ84_11905 [Burkholderiales bacterium]
MAYLHFGARFHVSVLNRRTLSFVKQICGNNAAAQRSRADEADPLGGFIMPGVLAGAGLTWLWHQVFPSAHAIEILLGSLLVLLCAQAAVLFVVAGQEK